jgi:hypothetical protein
MLSLTRKQMMVLLIVLLSFVATLIVSSAIIHATNPNFWFHIQQFVFGNYYG